MECPGLNGVWRACPPSIPGLTSVERDVFGALGGPLALIVVVSAIAILTIVAFTLTDGLGIGSSLRPRRWARARRIEAARRHAGRPAHLRLVERAAERHGLSIRVADERAGIGRWSRDPFEVPARAAAPSALVAARVYARRYLRRGLRRLRPVIAQAAEVVGASADAVLASAEAVATSAETAAASARDSIAALSPTALAAPRTKVAASETAPRTLVDERRSGSSRLSEAPTRARARARTARRGSRSAAGRGRTPGSRVGA